MTLRLGFWGGFGAQSDVCSTGDAKKKYPVLGMGIRILGSTLRKQASNHLAQIKILEAKIRILVLRRCWGFFFE